MEALATMKNEQMESVETYVRNNLKLWMKEDGLNPAQENRIPFRLSGDSERLTRIEEALKRQADIQELQLKQMEKEFARQHEETNRRFAEQREETNRRFAEQREETNQRFAEQKAELDKRFAEQQAMMDKRFEEQREETNRRFEDINKRFDDMHKTVMKHFNFTMLGFVVVSVLVTVYQLLG
ncbi:MAG: hypothetical protein B0D92_06575 [Spirochaeta sp. LUC14_002_19_P3]|nr:MAG: hypothetical protein B0D92_06575 [Spirochaeta sp. LUC14_002_19_P3]